MAVDAKKTDDEDEGTPEIAVDAALGVTPNGVPLGLTGGAGAASPASPTMNVMQILQSPEYKAKLAALSKRGQDALNEQKQGIDQNQEMIQKLSGFQSNAPLYNWIDDTTGSHLMRGYQDPAEKAKMVLGLQNMLQGQKKDMSKDEIDFIKSQLSSQFDPLKIQKEMAQIDYYNRYGQGGPVQGLQQQRQDFQEHQQVLKSVDNDKTNLQRIASTSNIANSLNNFANADIKSAAQLDELQQTIRSNLGIKGQGGVDEREKTYLNSLAQDLARASTYWKSGPQGVEKAASIVAHLKQLAALEQQNFQNQAATRTQALISGHESLYERNPTLKADLERKIEAAKKQYAPVLPVHGSTPHPLPDEEVDTDSGLSPKDQEALGWAKQNMHDPRAVQIFKKLGVH